MCSVGRLNALRRSALCTSCAGHAEKSLHTQLAVDTREVFLDYRHNSSKATDVTFNLKDFKAVLVLCEGLGTNVAICFDQPGSPLLVQPVFHSSNPLVRCSCCKTLQCVRLRIFGPVLQACGLTTTAVSMGLCDHVYAPHFGEDFMH